MKKSTLIFSALIAAALSVVLFSSCSKDKDPATYAVTVTSGTGGTASTDKTNPTEGETVTLTATPDDDYVFDKWTVVSGDGITFTPDANTSPATYTMPAGAVNIKAEFKLTLPVPDGSALDGITGGGKLPSGTTSYIGAFWKHDQTGERVIKINAGTTEANLGAWSAQVAWYDSKWDPANLDGVVLSTAASTDANLYDASPGDAENYQVSGYAATVSGTVASGEDIIFRIGLTKKFTAYNASTNPARYAVVVLTYGTPAVKQKLFLRQGEGADYVMRPGDKDGSGAAVGGTDDRSFAKKFLPYNLTDPAGNTATDYNAMTTAATGLLGVNGGAFTDYPTQAGYFFQWNKSTRAFHPTSPAGSFTNWSLSDGVALWSAATDETCPEGYRRPQDGANTAHNSTGAIAGSEMRQSLWLNPQASTISNLDNSIWGYYADGYFDRRAISSSVSSYSNTAVSPTTKDAAYVGRLFFNPISASGSYNASLFLPAAGYRSYVDGTLYYAGYYGFYWSSTSTSTDYAWYLLFSSGTAYQEYYYRTYGFTVRCVLQ